MVGGSGGDGRAVASPPAIADVAADAAEEA